MSIFVLSQGKFVFAIFTLITNCTRDFSQYHVYQDKYIKIQIYIWRFTYIYHDLEYIYIYLVSEYISRFTYIYIKILIYVLRFGYTYQDSHIYIIKIHNIILYIKIIASLMKYCLSSLFIPLTQYLWKEVAWIGSFGSDYEYDYEYEIRHFCAKPTPYACAISYSREKVLAVAYMSTKLQKTRIVLTTTF